MGKNINGQRDTRSDLICFGVIVSSRGIEKYAEHRRTVGERCPTFEKLEKPFSMQV